MRYKKNLPEIKIIKDNIKEETMVFSAFLYHTYYIQNRLAIFKAFPELGSNIEETKRENSKDLIHKFLVDFYGKNKAKIEEIVNRAEVMIKEKGAPALEELANLMDYKWPGGWFIRPSQRFFHFLRLATITI